MSCCLNKLSYRVKGSSNSSFPFLELQQPILQLVGIFELLDPPANLAIATRFTFFWSNYLAVSYWDTSLCCQKFWWASFRVGTSSRNIFSCYTIHCRCCEWFYHQALEWFLRSCALRRGVPICSRTIYAICLSRANWKVITLLAIQ